MNSLASAYEQAQSCLLCTGLHCLLTASCGAKYLQPQQLGGIANADGRSARSLEFMPGKQVGMSDLCYPDSLIGGIPNIYYYAANNPSEATIAKRRSYANTISYLTPPAENAGLYKGLKVRACLPGGSVRNRGQCLLALSCKRSTCRSAALLTLPM